jgi:hypothetical protein
LYHKAWGSGRTTPTKPFPELDRQLPLTDPLVKKRLEKPLDRKLSLPPPLYVPMDSASREEKDETEGMKGEKGV